MELSDDTVHSRANLLPEEIAHGGSVDPDAQAAAILEESEERIDAPSADADPDEESPAEQDDGYEHRRSEDTV